jgi:hypothetical protein
MNYALLLFGKPGWKDHLEDPGIEVWIILKLIFKKQDGRHGLDWSGSGQGHVVGYCKHGEPWGFDKMWRVCRLDKELPASQEGLYCRELSSQSVSWLPVIRYLVSFPSIY